MKTTGQGWAIEQLHQIAQSSEGAVEIVDITEPTDEGGRVLVTLSIDCSSYEHKPEGIRFKRRERLIIHIDHNFPLDVPRPYFSHKRYADNAHVQWGDFICLYRAPDTEWQPEDGMFGYMKRVDDWLRAAAAGELDPIGGPLHPPVTYAVASNPKIVPTQNTPKPHEPFWAGYAGILRESDARIELGQWIAYNDTVPNKRLAAVVLLPGRMPHEYPKKMSELLGVLEARQVPTDIVRLMVELGTLRGEKDKPLIFILGAAMRGIAGGERLQHLAAWRIDAEKVREFREAIGASTDDNPENLRAFYTWATDANIEWCSVLEDRPEIVQRRDADTPSAWWRGRKVAIFGCGAIGSAVAMLLARAGVAKLHVYDKDVVKPGVLVRQLFDRYQIGESKAKATAENVRHHNPELESIYSTADVLRILRTDERLAELLAADVIINATASGIVAAALEQHFRPITKSHPPIISMVLGHKADQALMTMAVQGAAGVTLDLDRRAKIALANVAHGKHVLDEFWPADPGRLRLFQPEPGCSSPTFRGSAADVLALTSRMVNAASEWLSTTSTNINLARTFELSGRHTGAVREFDFGWPTDVILPDARNGYQIRISHAAVAAMRAWMRRSERVLGRRTETGGILFGQVDEFLKVIWVDEVSGPPPDSIQTPEQFVCGTAGVTELNDEKCKRTRGSVSFVGMWHTHPEGMPIPSPTDHGAMVNLLTGDQFDAKRFLMVIIGATAARPLVSGTVFERADYQQ